MGFYSFISQSDGKSIANVHSSREAVTVYMHDHEGNVYVEKAYEGYGDFGGVNYYDLMARMNNLEGSWEAIQTYFAESGTDHIKWPNVVTTSDWTWKNERPQSCPEQGFFYY
jgi:hypothetical protein